MSFIKKFSAAFWSSFFLIFLTVFFLSPFALSQAAQPANYFRFYMMPAHPVAMNWKTPKDLLASSLKAIIVNGTHSIGHVSIEVNCPSIGGAQSRVFTGAVPVSSKQQTELLLKHQIGFSLLEYSWQGKLEDPEDIRKALKVKRRSRDKLAIATFLVSESTCQRLLAYHRELAETDLPLFYGNSPQPRRKEGSGCTAFGVSFLELAGVMTDQLRQRWITARRVPFGIMAGYDPEKVHLLDVFRLPAGKSWAQENEPHMALETFDPNLMYAWIRELAENPADLKSLGGKLDRSLTKAFPVTPAIQIDYRQVPTPTEPIFLPGPYLKHVNDFTVIRSDKRPEANGSFELKP